ncbi:hypothetical protein [Falsibacillus pallidus]|uniref:hypothetical protein n=1 Tax=Falsibacillus pallidus TaxID=493781 RepID=UPI003D976ECB
MSQIKQNEPVSLWFCSRGAGFGIRVFMVWKNFERKGGENNVDRVGLELWVEVNRHHHIYCNAD